MMLLNTGESYTVDQADIIQWQKTYKAIDVYQELMAMESWCDANPTKRKTKKGIKRFINSWLARAQDRGGSPMAYNNKIAARKPIEMDLVDIGWLSGEDLQSIKEYYLKKYGYYYYGEKRTA